MRQINLNSVYYKIHSDIVQRRLNPWKAKIGAGGLEYSDFSQAELEEYFDFRNGIGKKRGVGSDARQDWSEGIDFSNEGQAVLGPLVTTAGTAPALVVPTIVNADMETAKNGSWLDGQGTWLRSDTYSKEGTYSWGLDAQIGDYFYQDLAGFVPGAQYTFTCWGTGAQTKRWKIGINDGVDTTYGTSVTVATQGTFQQSTYTKTLSVVATRLRIICEAVDAAVLYFDLAAISTPTAFGTFTPIKIRDFQSKTYVIGDKGLIKWNTTSSDWDVKLVYANPIDIIVATDATDEYLIISTAAAAIYSADGDTWTALDAKCKGYLAFYDAKLRALDTDGGTLHSSPANDIDGVWTEFNLTGNFGTVYDLFEGKLLSDGIPTLYFCGTEGLFTIDTTNEIAYQQEVSYPPLTYAGHRGIYWNANVWVATGYGILKVAPSVATYLGPDQDDGLPASYQGNIYDFTTVNNWLVFCVNAGAAGYSSILKRNSTLGGNQQVYTGAVNAAIACIHHSPSSLYTNGRLWFSEGTGIKYMMFPDTTSNVKQIATYEYVDDSGYGKLPIFRKLAAISKTALGVAAITKSCVDADNEYIQVFYGLNGAAPTTSLGTFLTSPKPTALTFGSGLGTEFYTIQLAVKLFRGSTETKSPELESLLFYYIPTPVRISGWTLTIIASEDDSQEIFEAFETIYDTNTLVAFYPSGDVNKTSYNVKLTQMPSRSWWEEQGAREGQFQVTLEEVFKS